MLRNIAILLILLILLAVGRHIANPLLDNRIIFSVGAVGDAYEQTARQYARLLAREGIEVEILPGVGSLQTLHRLVAGTADVGFVQGGTAQNYADRGLISYGSMFYEPIWMFYRPDLGEIQQLTDLAGKRVGVGSAGSGTQVAAQALLRLNGLNDSNARLVSLSTRKMADMLIAGELDFAFFVTAPQSPLVTVLLDDPHVELFNAQRVAAYSAHFSFMSYLTIPMGLINVIENQPAMETNVPTVTAHLVAREELHPDVERALLRAAVEIHNPKGLLEQEREFPSIDHIELPISDVARRFYLQGESWLESSLPLRIGGMAERLLTVTVPLVTLFVLYQTLAPIYSFLISVQTTRWYSILADIERRRDAMNLEQLDQELDSLYRIRNTLMQTRLPFIYLPSVYGTRSTVDMVIDSLQQRKGELMSEEIQGEVV